MPHYIGLDVSQKETEICVIDGGDGTSARTGLPAPLSASPWCAAAKVDWRVFMDIGSPEITDVIIEGISVSHTDRADLRLGR
jgi:hypothetical protein